MEHRAAVETQDVREQLKKRAEEDKEMLQYPKQISESIGAMLVYLRRCPICANVMVPQPSGDTFPLYYTFDAQVKRAGWRIRSGVRVDDEKICKTCAAEGKATFLCVICEQRKSTDKIQESIGDPPEFMCKDCYETVPAKTWRETYDRLYKEHRYDFE